MKWRPEGWNEELYEKLSYDYLIECAKNERIEECNKKYEDYLKSEWERIFPDEGYDAENIGRLFYYGSHFQRPDYKNKDFKNAIRKEAYFSSAHLDGANFPCAHLEEVDFSDACLYGSNFWSAHLDDANFLDAHFEGALFNIAIVNGETLFAENTLDKKTDFTGTPLSSARIDQNIRTQLERNIRQIHWEEWYEKPKLYPALAKIKNALIVKFSARKSPEKKKWETKRCWVDRIINAFVRTFWWISNYGSSTKRIIAVFFGWNILWAFIYYYLLPFLLGINTTVLNVSNIWAVLLQTNLMMFSITDLATEGLDILPMLFVTIHIVVGYFILVALITRLGIMFQNLSP